MDEEVPCGGDHILVHLLCRVQLRIQALDAKHCGSAPPMVLVSSFLTVPQCMRDLSSPTRDQTHAPCSGSAEYQPLGCQESPSTMVFISRAVIIWTSLMA